MGQKLGGIQEEYGSMWKEGLENRLEPNDGGAQALAEKHGPSLEAAGSPCVIRTCKAES